MAPLVAPPPPTAEPVAPPPAAQADAEAGPAKPSLTELMAKAHAGMNEALDAHDADKFAAFLAEDVTVSVPGTPDIHGRAAVAASMKSIFAALGDLKVADVRTFVKGNVQITDFVLDATMTGDFMGIKATKKPIGGRRIVIAWFDDAGLVTKWHEYVDLAGTIAQMKGAKDAPAVPPMPSAPVEAHVAKGSRDEDDQVDWFARVNDAFNTGDPKAVDVLVAPDAEATVYLLGGKAMKAKEVTAFDADLSRAFSKPKYAVDGVWAIDGFVVTERTLTGTHKARFGSVPPSNKEVTVHLAEVLLPGADGKIQKAWTYGNLGEIAAPPPPAKEPATAAVSPKK
jgi:predicted ester cyclase